MTVSTTSTVPAVLDYLVGAVRFALPDVEVVDGQPVRDVERDVVLIGFTGNPGEAAVTDTRTREQMSASPDRERYEVTCLASSWPGGDTDDQSVKAARDRAYELVDAVNAEIVRDQTLGGRVLRARLMSDLFAQAQTSQGPVATVRFVIEVTAFTG